jgi:predicted PurR-regulated permease PerM
MDKPAINPDKFRITFLLILVVTISAIFFAMIRSFMTALLMAAICSGLMFPLYRRFRSWLGGRRALASVATLVVFVVVLIVPLSAFFGIVTAQALEVSGAVGPWIEERVSQPDEIDRFIQNLPFMDALAPYKDQIETKVGELAGRVGQFVVARLAAATRGTVLFFFMLFVMLYAMFFFLKDGRSLLRRILYYMPLSSEDEARMVGKFVSVTRATVKGTLLIGVVQGGLAGIAFAIAGIPGAAFWGTIMAVLSIIPGVGTALVWVPAVVYLLAIGHVGAGIGLGLWCGAVVGTVDNLMRPWLVGRDTEMPDLLILLGTLGGIVLFGAVGVIIGPIVAALFVTVWEIYGTVFKDVLPEVVLGEDTVSRAEPSPATEA